MSKRIGYLYEKMYDIDFVKRMIIKASKNKTHRKDVRRFLAKPDKYARQIIYDLKCLNYNFKRGHTKIIKSINKERLIMVPSFKDQVVHNMLMDIMQPIIMKGMYKYNAGVVPGRGTIYAKRYIEGVINRHKPTYCLKMDIKKYFHNVDTKILFNQLARRIKDKKFLDLIRNLLDAGSSESGKGIPIGFYTSQWFSNFYLQQLDHYIKQVLGVKFYCRYVDDLVIMGNNKRKLHRIKGAIVRYLKEELKLELNNKHQVFPIDKRGIDFVGYIFKHRDIKLRKRTFKMFKRRLNSLKRNKINIFLCRLYMSLRGWLLHFKRGLRYLANNVTKKLHQEIVNYISTFDKERLIVNEN